MAKLKGDSGQLILDFIKAHPGSSSKEIHDGLGNIIAYATVKRIIKSLVADYPWTMTEGRELIAS